MSLGTPQIEPALVDVPVIPAVAGQVCTATATVTATFLIGTTPANFAGNGATTAVTIDFLPGQPPPFLMWYVGQSGSGCPNTQIEVRAVISSSNAGTVGTSLMVSEFCSHVSPASVTMPDPRSIAGIARTGLGYYLLERSSSIFRFGAGNMGYDHLGYGFPRPAVGIAAAPQGSWVALADGGVATNGGSVFYGSMGGSPLRAPVLGIAATPDGGGYWLVGADGGVFAFGDAGFFGSVPGVLPAGKSLNQPIVGIASTPDGEGYWTVAADGGVFAFGDAHFYGSMGGTRLNAPVVGMAGSSTGGYWLVGSDGGAFSFNAPFEGSMGSVVLSAPITGIAATSDGLGYWMSGSDGGVFAFGDAPFWGCAVNFAGPDPIPLGAS